MGFAAVPSIILRNSCVAALPCEATYVSFVPSGERPSAGYALRSSSLSGGSAIVTRATGKAAAAVAGWRKCTTLNVTSATASTAATATAAMVTPGDPLIAVG